MSNWISSNVGLIYKGALCLSLVFLLAASWNAPISGDEYVHVQQAKKNLQYLKTFGADKEALDTPISRLKHYGQSFDTITFWIADSLDIDNLYRFRHVCNAIVAWLIILFSSLITRKITKSEMAALTTVLLFMVSDRFLGHGLNNLKDIPFTFSFVFSIYFTFLFLEKLPKISWIYVAFIVLGIAFGISIRIGGLLIFALFILFTGLHFYVLVVSGEIKKRKVLRWIWKLGGICVGTFVASYFLGILLWPFALENPLLNPWESLSLMHHYPTSVRQVFEGKLIWSDKFPWYYLYKYLWITLPLVVLLGFGLSLGFLGKIKSRQSIIWILFTLIAFGFPVFYAAASGANVYGGWRQVLFCYPFLVVLASVGWWAFFSWAGDNIKMKIAGLLVFLILAVGPIAFAVRNFPYLYTYFNPFVGGVQGAYGNYEIDYYFTSFQKAYQFIDQEVGDQPKIVAANFIIPEYYRNKNYKPKLIDYYDRSSSDWDYAVICNTFLDPYQLRSGVWPPANTVYVEKVDGKPILAVLKRESIRDLEGKRMLDEGKYNEAVVLLTEALKDDTQNTSILLNLAKAYMKLENHQKSMTILDRLQSIYPDNEWATNLRGEIYLSQGQEAKAMELFQHNIEYNYKFYYGYLALAKLSLSNGYADQAIKYLKACLRINPYYAPAYHLYGQILVERGEVELGKKMIEFTIEGNSKYGRK